MNGSFLGLQMNVGGSGLNYAGTNLNNAPANLKIGQAFIAHEAEIDYFWIRIGGVTGTDANRRITFELQTDSAGVPSGTVLQTFEQVGGFTVNAQKKITPNWSNSNMTPGARYWIVITNTSVVPTVEYVSIGCTTIAQPIYSLTYNASLEWYQRTFNGTNWTTVIVVHGTGLTIKFASGELHGQRANIGSSYEIAWTLDGRNCGIEFQIPKNSATWNITGVSLYVYSAPITRLLLYRNRTLAAVSPYSSVVSAHHWMSLPLKAELRPGDLISILAESVPGSVGLVYGDVYTNDPDFLGMKPFGGTARKVKLVSDVWTVDELTVPGLYLYLDYNNPFKQQPLNRRKYINQR